MERGGGIAFPGNAATGRSNQSPKARLRGNQNKASYKEES